jgi:hypothetical protein
MDKFGHQVKDEMDYLGGKVYRFAFKNGYGASVVSHSGSYGGKQGLWELAVCGKEGEVDYTTPITNDVIGYLKESEVKPLLDKIAALKE